MTTQDITTVLWFAAGACGLAGSVRFILQLRPGPRLLPPDSGWPWPLRICGWPARCLAPAFDAILPSSMVLRVRRRLEKADLHPGIEPAQWVALCCVLGIVIAIPAAAAMAFANTGIKPAVVAAMGGWVATEFWLRRRVGDCERRIVRELPPCLDLLTVCVEAGATLTAAIRLIVDQAPPSPLRNYFDRVLREVRSGRMRSHAFVSVAESYGVECLSTLASSLAHAEAAGMSVGQVLRTQSEQRSTERFARAERQAMQAPVKMLGPLIFCIFPCTFIVLAVPIAHKLMEAFA